MSPSIIIKWVRRHSKHSTESNQKLFWYADGRLNPLRSASPDYKGRPNLASDDKIHITDK